MISNNQQTTSASSIQRATASAESFATDVSAHLKQKNQDRELAERLRLSNSPCAQKVEALNTRMRMLSPGDESVMKEKDLKKDLLACVEYILEVLKATGHPPLKPDVQKNVIEEAKAYIEQLLAIEASSTKEDFYQLINKINSFVGSLITGKPQNQLLRNIEQEAQKDCRFSAFIASHELADSIIDLLTDPSNLEATFAQFQAFCKKQRQVSKSPSQAEVMASMKAGLADLLEEEERKEARKNSKKKASQKSAFSTSPALSSTKHASAFSSSPARSSATQLSPTPSQSLGLAMHASACSSPTLNSSMLASAVSPSPSISPSMQRSFGSNPLPNISFGSNPLLDNRSPSLSPILPTPKGGLKCDSTTTKASGWKQVPVRETNRSTSRPGFEDLLDKILSDTQLPISVNDHVARWEMVQTLDEVRTFPDRSTKGGSRYAGMKDPQIVEQIFRHDASSIDSLLQSELFRKHYVKSASDRHHLLKVKLQQGKSVPKNWTIATIALAKKALSEEEELVHFYCHDISELNPSNSNAEKSLISMLFPTIEGIDLDANSASTVQTQNTKARSTTLPQPSTTITTVPQENGPPLLKVTRQHPLAGASTLWIAPILR